jgi:hypothetical protein
LTALAESAELEHMVVYAKTTLVAESCFECGKTVPDGITTGKVDYLATAGAYQVMVVFWCAGSIAGTIIAGVELADKAQVCQ